MMEKVKGLEIGTLDLDNMVTESEVLANTNSFSPGLTKIWKEKMDI